MTLRWGGDDGDDDDGDDEVRGAAGLQGFMLLGGVSPCGGPHRHLHHLHHSYERNQRPVQCVSLILIHSSICGDFF